jgi:hypothetical protein
MRRRGECASVVLLTLSVELCGCSFLLSDRAPPRDQWPTEHTFDEQLKSCTTSPVLPILDGASVVGIGVGAFYAGRGSGDAAPAAAGLAALPALFYLASALYGWSAGSTCRTYLAGPPYEPDRGR